MARRLVYKDSAIENSATVVLGRITDVQGYAVTQDAIQSITLRVYEQTTSTGTLIVPDGENPMTYDGTVLTISDVIFDTPVVDDIRWPYGDEEDIDGTGYNLAIALDGSYLPEGNKVYRVEVEVVPLPDEYNNIIGLTYYLLWELTTTNIWSA